MSSVKLYNAAELWKKETDTPAIPTFSRSLDEAFGNDGVQLGAITEILGLPGSGKTQLCLQLCASVQVPIALGGLNAEALFIDTNTNFTINRFQEILSGTLNRCHKLLNLECLWDEDEALKKLHYVDAFGLDKFVALIYRLPNILNEKQNIKLIVIDSIAFPFKDNIDLKQRTGLLYRMMAEVQKLAFEKHIAVVLTNEMSTRIGLSGGAIVGALGDSWAHRCNKRMVLSMPEPSDNLRHAVLIKSNNSPESVGSFLVTRDGIRDIE